MGAGTPKRGGSSKIGRGFLPLTVQVGITADRRSPKWGVNSKSGQNLQNGAGSLRAKTFTIGFGFSQLLLTYISK